MNTEIKPHHCTHCGKFLKRIRVVGLNLFGRSCVDHGLMRIEGSASAERLMEAYINLHRENSYLLRKYMGKGRIK